VRHEGGEGARRGARNRAPTPPPHPSTRPGLALSQDGTHWARVEADHHTGALLDAGDAGAWDAHFVAAPQLVAAGPGDMRMYYHSFDEATRKWTVGVAASPDGLKWARGGVAFAGGGSTFDAAGAAARHVVRDTASKRWVMFYEGVAADGGRSIGVATSADGLSGWTASPTPVLTPGPPGAWDDGAVGAPCAVPMAAGRWRLYYGGRSGRARAGAFCGVGLALMDAPADDEAPGLAEAAWRRRGGEPPAGVAPRGGAL